MVYETVVQSVDYRDVNRRSDGKQIRIFQVHTADGVIWTTSRKDIANEAARLTGQPVQIQGRQEQNGVYENFFLDDIHLPGTQPAQQGGGQFAPPQATGFTPAAPVIVQPQPTTSANTMAQPSVAPQGPTPTDWAIWRQTAAKVSAHISQSADEFWRNVDDLVNYFAYSIKPQPTPQTRVPGPSPAPLQPQQNQFIPESAYNDPGPQPGHPLPTDDDIPF